ncbi:neuritin 1-like a isoform X1 [Anguilla anguilla]|uniref:neuritin 1-like a isoform X1 n=2 Tax=Anguilla anguilla TaxID=7936 RepID=UPI0015A77D0F|nr:neuritin 1-like a isoform X1 [Anguilla anguilla]
MRSRLNYACFLVPVALQFMLGLSPAMTASTRKCGSIYRGFAQCLLALGDSMSNSVQREESPQEIDSICRSWDEFHTCASAVLAGCPEEAAAVWDSLRQESKKMQFSGNLYDMCANRAQPITTVQSPPTQEETNQESLKGHAHALGPAHALFLPACLSLLALLAVM